MSEEDNFPLWPLGGDVGPEQLGCCLGGDFIKVNSHLVTTWVCGRGWGRRRERDTNTLWTQLYKYIDRKCIETCIIYLTVSPSIVEVAIFYILKSSPKDLLRYYNMLEPKPSSDLMKTHLRMHYLTLKCFWLFNISTMSLLISKLVICPSITFYIIIPAHTDIYTHI